MKAMLVIDVPDDFETKTAIAIVDVKNEKGEGVTAMCPLKLMPIKVRTDEDDIEVDSYWTGWNECIEAIEK